MADVLIVCVREDEPQAKALADMFEAAGFSIGGAPSNDAALRSSGAGVVVWSQASIRSRPFLDAAQRVINAGKAVVASLIEPPPASSIGDSPAFDLSRWDGDPNDPTLDSLFFAVDRMVNAARAAVGANPAQPAAPAYDEPPPPPRPAPAPTKAATPRAAPTRSPQRETREPQGAPALEAEAEHWRAIRDSRDPADFMDYLARYGTDGAFSEVAEIKLKRLTQGAGGAPMRQAPPPMPRATPRAEAPPPPMRRPEPPPRRYEPPPASARPPIGDRVYDRADIREPARREGGALRAFVLIGLLGAAGVGGFLYYTNNLPQNAEQPRDVQVDPPPPLGEPVDAAGDGSLSFSEASSAPIEPSAQRRETAQRRSAQTQRETQPEQRSPAQRTEAFSPPVPPPVASWSNDAAAGGPISLTPGAATQQPGADTVSPPAQLIQNVEVAANPTPDGATAAAPQARVIWTQTPSARRIAELYPSAAANNGTGGRVVLDCVVQASLEVTCTVASATPAGVGFDRAALRLAGSWRARATRSDGSNAVGARTRIAVNFQPPAR